MKMHRWSVPHQQLREEAAQWCRDHGVDPGIVPEDGMVYDSHDGVEIEVLRLENGNYIPGETERTWIHLKDVEPPFQWLTA